MSKPAVLALVVCLLAACGDADTVSTDTTSADTGADTVSTDTAADTASADASDADASSPCAPSPCGDHGSCSVDAGAAVCACDSAWAGDACDRCDIGFAPAGAACEPCNDHTFTYIDAAATEVLVTGTWVNWAATPPGATAMTSDSSGTWTATVTLPVASQQQYKFIVDGTWVQDPTNPFGVDDTVGGLNSVVDVCGLCGDLGAFAWQDTVMYFAMVDRFHDSDGMNDPVADVTEDNGNGASGQYLGGDLEGVTEKLGYLTDLGVSALWLSAPFDNRETRGRGINDPFYYAGYHGYWPSPEDIDYTDPDSPVPTPQVESRIGTAADLTALVTAAHAATSSNGHNVKVLFDYVMNHVDIESGLYQAHPDWFTKDDAGEIPLCEPNNWWDHEFWGTRCAFTTYLPAFDMWQDEVRDWSLNDAVWWAKAFDIDGYRLDAIKHVPLDWLQRLRVRLDAEIPDAPGDRFYLVGETFDYFNRDVLKAFINPDTMLDGQFDFPFKKRACESIFIQGGLDSFAAWMDGNDAYYDIEGASKPSLMTTWIGNHDIPRAIHFAARQITNCSQGSDTSNAWTDNYPQPTEANGYEHLGVAFAVMMTAPGIPLIYYGDEIGLAGGGDPDNRRMMPWDDSALNAHQLALRANVRALSRLRGSHKALTRGRRTTLSATGNTWVYRMGGCGDPSAPDVVVAINRGNIAGDVTLPAGLIYTDLLDDAGSGSVSAGTLSMPPRSFRVFEVARTGAAE